MNERLALVPEKYFQAVSLMDDSRLSGHEFKEKIDEIMRRTLEEASSARAESTLARYIVPPLQVSEVEDNTSNIRNALQEIFGEDQPNA